MFQLEAEGLAALARASPPELRVPFVVAVSKPEDDVQLIVLEWVEPGVVSASCQAATGRGLALLHRQPVHDVLPFVAAENWLGLRRQRNTPWPTPATWPGFFWTHRLEPELRTATDRGLLGPGLVRRLRALGSTLPERLATDEPMSLLHGDLWSGNRIADQAGQPWLIDPAVCVGHREVDLAMMALFGGFDADCLGALEAVWPRAPGHAQRRPVYQLYYLLIHVTHFGAAWVPQLVEALAAAEAGR